MFLSAGTKSLREAMQGKRGLFCPMVWKGTIRNSSEAVPIVEGLTVQPITSLWIRKQKGEKQIQTITITACLLWPVSPSWPCQRLHSLLKQHHQLRTRYSSKWARGGHFTFQLYRCGLWSLESVWITCMGRFLTEEGCFKMLQIQFPPKRYPYLLIWSFISRLRWATSQPSHITSHREANLGKSFHSWNFSQDL